MLGATSSNAEFGQRCRFVNRRLLSGTGDFPGDALALGKTFGSLIRQDLEQIESPVEGDQATIAPELGLRNQY